jgi:hypothetical protein
MAVRPNGLKTFSILLIVFLHLKKNDIDPLQSTSQYTSVFYKELPFERMANSIPKKVLMRFSDVTNFRRKKYFNVLK